MNDLALCPRFNGISLCSGYGGLELGIERLFPESRTVCFVEGELFAAQHLVKKMEEGKLDKAPIWSNVKTFNGEPWRGKVDWIAAGFPCQPYSSVGKEMADQDPRDLWPDIVRIIREVRPAFIFLENVSRIVKLRLDQIILDLGSLGYSASWVVMAASAVGAKHERKRWFCMAVKNDTNPHGFRFNEDKQPSPRRQFDVEGLCRNVSKTDKWGGRFESIWKVEPSMGRLVDGASDWVDKLRLLGNGVVPQQAAYAFQILGERLACGMVENRTPKD